MLIKYTLLEAKENIKFTILTFPIIYRNFFIFSKEIFSTSFIEIIGIFISFSFNILSISSINIPFSLQYFILSIFFNVSSLLIKSPFHSFDEHVRKTPQLGLPSIPIMHFISYPLFI